MTKHLALKSIKCHLNHHRYTAAFEEDQLTFNLVTYAMSPPLPPPLQVPALRCNPPTITLWLIHLHYWEDTATGPAHQAIKLKQFSNINMVINWRGGRLSDWLWQGGQAGVVFCRMVTVWWHVMQAPPGSLLTAAGTPHARPRLMGVIMGIFSV